jgi:hypothetical protein
MPTNAFLSPPIDDTFLPFPCASLWTLSVIYLFDAMIQALPDFLNAICSVKSTVKIQPSGKNTF